MTVAVTEPPCSLGSLGDDQLLTILCLLRPSDLAACALVSRRLRFLCQNESHLWFLKCQSEWSSTCVRRWSSLDPPCDHFYRRLHHFLTEWTPLLGFWRDISGHLYFFRWQASYMEGIRLDRIRPFCTDLTPVPCLSLGLSPGGHPLCLLETAPSSLPETADGQSPLQRWCRRDLPAETVSGPFSSLYITAKNDINHDRIPLAKLPSSPTPHHLASDSASPVLLSPTSPQPLPATPPCLLAESPVELPVNVRLVRVQLVGKEHAVIEECRSPTDLPRVPSGGSPSPSPIKYQQASWESDSSLQNDSSGVVPYERYGAYASRSLCDLGRKKQRGGRRRRGKGEDVWEAKHLVRIPQDLTHPSDAHPLQGLWKAVSQNGDLNIVLVVYENGAITCRHISYGERNGGGKVEWECNPSVHFLPPFSQTMEKDFRSRRHFLPHRGGRYHWDIREGGESAFLRHGDVEGLQFDTEEIEMEESVTRIYSTSDTQERESLALDGKVWVYANGNFAYGPPCTSYVLDYQRVSSTL